MSRTQWGEFDLVGAVWTVPATHMKRGGAHRVPLSTGALAVLDEAQGLTGGRGLAFPARAAASSRHRGPDECPGGRPTEMRVREGQSHLDV